MPKYSLDFFVESRDVSVESLFDYGKYAVANAVIPLDDPVGYQIISPPGPVAEPGFANVYYEKFESFSLIEGSYELEVLDKIREWCFTGKAFSIIFVLDFGFRFVDDSLRYINDNLHVPVYVMHEMSSEIFDFQNFYRRYLNEKFFWIESWRGPA